MPPIDDTDVIDRAAGLSPGERLHAARRFRDKVVAATEASRDALLSTPVDGLSSADRLRVAGHVCTLAGAPTLAAYYDGLLADVAAGVAAPSAALPAMLRFATALTVDPRRGDRAAIEALRGAGLAEPAIVALAQLVGFLSYQIRVVAGLRAMRAAAEASAP